MPNLSAVLKSEITRLSKKAAKQEVGPVHSAATALRHQLAALKKQFLLLQRELAALKKASAKSVPVSEPEDGAKHRFTAKGLKSLRSRLELSAEDFGLLIDVSGQSIYKWEQGKSVPRKANIPAIAELRTIGKREATARLASLKKPGAAAAT